MIPRLRFKNQAERRDFSVGGPHWITCKSARHLFECGGFTCLTGQP